MDPVRGPLLKRLHVSHQSNLREALVFSNRQHALIDRKQNERLSITVNGAVLMMLIQVLKKQYPLVIYSVHLGIQFYYPLVL